MRAAEPIAAPLVTLPPLQNPLNAARAFDDAPTRIQNGNGGVGVGFFAPQARTEAAHNRFPARSGTRGDNLRFSVDSLKSPLPPASGMNFWKAVPD